MDVKTRALKGFRWTAALTLFSALVGPLTQIVKARFLEAAELGAVAIFIIVYGALQVIENAGMQETLIQKKELGASERFTLFMLSILLGTLGTLVMLLSARTIEQHTGVPGSSSLLIAASPLFFLAQMKQFFRALLTRDLIYKGASIVEMFHRSINIVLLLLFLMYGLGAVSVVYALLIATVFSTTGIFILSIRQGLLRFESRINFEALRYFWTFGVPIALKRIFTYFTRRADELVVAISLTPEILGLYHLAKETLEKLMTLILSSFSKVLLPLFSRIKENTAKLNSAYERITLAVSYAGIPVFVGVCLTAGDVIPAVFGEKWTQAVFPFQVLSIAAIPSILTANLATSLLYSVGKSKGVLLVDVIVNSMYLFVLYMWGHHGLHLILFSYLGYSFIKVFSLQSMVNRSLTITPMAHIGLYLRVLSRVVIMATAVIVMQFIIKDINVHVLNAVLLVVTGMTMMAGVTYFTDRDAVNQIKMLFKVN